MTEEKQMEFLDRLIRNGVNIGQLIMDNHGTMEITTWVAVARKGSPR